MKPCWTSGSGKRRAGRPTARRLHRAAHKNSDQDNEAGSVERRANCIRDGL
jgi:hypothetical protein